jgi:hypothetical protein
MRLLPAALRPAYRKGSALKFAPANVDIVWQHKRACRRSLGPRVEFSFLLDSTKGTKLVLYGAGGLLNRDALESV